MGPSQQATIARQAKEMECGGENWEWVAFRISRNGLKLEKIRRLRRQIWNDPRGGSDTWLDLSLIKLVLNS